MHSLLSPGARRGRRRRSGCRYCTWPAFGAQSTERAGLRLLGRFLYDARMVSNPAGFRLPGWGRLAALVLALWPGPGAASEPRGIYLVDDFGAVHDGKTDDGPAIRAAIAACSATGGIVQFGPGVYVFRDSLEVVTS